jgi:hypothetical protein
MPQVFTGLIALVLGMALPALCMAIVRRSAQAPDGRDTPLPPTRHARRVKVSDTAA